MLSELDQGGPVKHADQRFIAGITVWNRHRPGPLMTMVDHASSVLSVAFDPTRPQVATGSVDGTIRIWDTRTGETSLVLPTAAAVTGLSYSPDGRYLAAANVQALPVPGTVSVYMLELDDAVAEAESRLTRDFTDAECRRYLEHRAC